MPDLQDKPQRRLPPEVRSAFKVASVYAAAGALWILFSDKALLMWFRDPEQIAQFQTYKGWFYVAVTAALVYVLVRRTTGRIIHSQEALNRSEALLRNIVDNTSAMVTVRRADGRLLLVNSRFEQVVGMDRAELLGKTWGEVLPPELAEQLSERDGEVLSTGRPITTEDRYSVCGEDRYFLSITFPLKSRSGDAFACCGIATDITERKKDAEARRQLEAQLRRSQKMEAVGLLAGGVAHDFNNLMTVIAGHADLLAVRLEDVAAAQDSLEAIQAAVRHATEITRSLLTYSRDLRTERGPLNLSAAVESMAASLRPSLPEDLTLHVEAGDQPCPWILGNEVQLQQVLLNLAMNARDAMRDGGTLRIAVDWANGVAPAEETPAERGTVRIVVQDTGGGMPPEVLDRLFEPFFTTKDRGKGTGLGLAMAHGIVANHGGRIDVQSHLGKGTTFVIELPTCAPPEPAAPAG